MQVPPNQILNNSASSWAFFPLLQLSLMYESLLLTIQTLFISLFPKVMWPLRSCHYQLEDKMVQSICKQFLLVNSRVKRIWRGAWNSASIFSIDITLLESAWLRREAPLILTRHLWLPGGSSVTTFQSSTECPSPFFMVTAQDCS